MRPFPGPSNPIKTNRDLMLLPLGKGQLLVVSCDAAGAIGSKRHDVVRAHPRVVGQMTARVALMELLAIGAHPICLVGTLCVEPEPTGNQMIKGVFDEVRRAKLGSLEFLWSTEKNIRVSQTAVGVTGIGLLSLSKMMIGRCKPGDAVVAIGEPQFGKMVLAGEKNKKLAETRDVCELRDMSFVHEIIPVGSRGIGYEARTLAVDSNLSLRLENPKDTQLRKSAGPATVILCAIPKGKIRQIWSAVPNKPVSLIGELNTRGNE